MIGIMTAMDAELRLIRESLDQVYEVRQLGMREFTRGRWGGEDVVVVQSRWGKTAAASTAAALVYHFYCDCILLAGVAGAVHPSLRRGDIVVATHHVHQESDWSPFYQRGEIPMVGIREIPSDEVMVELIQTAVGRVIGSAQAEASVFSGLAATGDRFLRTEQEVHILISQFPGALIFDSEGASVAQVCYEHEVPFVAVRAVSDQVGQDASGDFVRFLQQSAADYCVQILREFVDLFHARRIDASSL
ncbi:MAG: 5'-methylthioadenosine/adenosylhomocysteine nucleosidase [Chlamydiia bacterium]